MRNFIAAICLFMCASPAWAQDFRLQTSAASELQTMCADDAGRLWGVSLCGPLIVVDPRTRQAWATQRDGQNLFTLTSSGAWVGPLPQGVPVANTTVDWAGIRWIMVVGPLPEDAMARRVLIAHEAWHRVQSSIGLPMQNTNGVHLETERGRYLMRLELRALATAMLSNGRARRDAAQDALSFRSARLASFPDAPAAEAGLDRNEGLAAYTGVRLGAGDQASLLTARTLNAYDTQPSLARSYAYATGPAYGLLLDEYVPDWRIALAAWAPADLLSSPLRIRDLSSRNLQRRAERYGGSQISAQERVRAEARSQVIAGLRAQFSGARLELPLRQMQLEFDPEGVTPVEGLGTVYQTLTLRDAWGEIRATRGALVSSDFGLLTVSEPIQSGLAGPGWVLALALGYRISAADPAGIMRPELNRPPPSTDRRADD